MKKNFFIWNNILRHQDITPVGKDREGYVIGGLSKIQDDGYTKNNKIHSTDELMNTLGSLKNMDSYQSR